MARLLDFPATVDERAARTVAAGVVAAVGTAIASDRLWLTLPVAYGFAARFASGPRYSPLAQFATKVVVPRLPGEPRPVAGKPKRLAQGAGLVMSGSALVLGLLMRRRRAAKAVLSALLVAAALESCFGICLACKAFPLLVRAGLVEEADCADCSDITARR